MYKTLLYNDDCILLVDMNTVIFEDDIEWSEYVKWKTENPKLEEEILLIKNNLLLWNGGNPHIEDNKKMFWNTDGILIKEELENEVLYYNLIGKVYKREYIKNNKVVLDREYSESTGIVFKETNHQLNAYKLFCMESGSVTHYIRTKGDFEYSAFYKNEIYYKTVLKRKNKIIKLRERYPNSVILKDKSTFKNGEAGYDYVDYYSNGNVRSNGTLNLEKKMEGKWKFYHSQNNIESEHSFKNGKLVGKSSLFYENGNLYREINHD